MSGHLNINSFHLAIFVSINIINIILQSTRINSNSAMDNGKLI